MHDGGEVDIRGVYCAVAVAILLNLEEKNILFENTPQWLAQCQAYEGGFSGGARGRGPRGLHILWTRRFGDAGPRATLRFGFVFTLAFVKTNEIRRRIFGFVFSEFRISDGEFRSDRRNFCFLFFGRMFYL